MVLPCSVALHISIGNKDPHDPKPLHRMSCLDDFINISFQVLHIDPRNDKALYRRGQANFALKNYDSALSDLREAEKVSPNDKAIRKLFNEVRQSYKIYNDVQKQRLSKFFRDQTENVTVGYD